MVDFPLPCLLVVGEGGGGVFSLLISAISIACFSDKLSGAQVDDDMNYRISDGYPTRVATVSMVYHCLLYIVKKKQIN